MVSLKQEFAGELHQLKTIRAFLRDVCRAAGWQQKKDEETIIRLELALNEAIANIVLHGIEEAPNPPPNRTIEMTVEADAERICVTLNHHGRAFDPKSAPPPIFNGSREHGFGLYLIEQCVHEVKYFQEQDGRCAVRLVQKRKTTC